MRRAAAKRRNQDAHADIALDGLAERQIQSRAAMMIGFSMDGERRRHDYKEA